MVASPFWAAIEDSGHHRRGPVAASIMPRFVHDMASLNTHYQASREDTKAGAGPSVAIKANGQQQ